MGTKENEKGALDGTTEFYVKFKHVSQEERPFHFLNTFMTSDRTVQLRTIILATEALLRKEGVFKEGDSIEDISLYDVNGHLLISGDSLRNEKSQKSTDRNY